MNKKTTFTFIFTTILNYSITIVLSLAISHWFGYNLKDVLFVIGLFTLVIGIISNISGNPNGLSLNSLGNINSQYVANVDFKANDHEKIENRPTVNLKFLITSALLISSTLILISAYFL